MDNKDNENFRQDSSEGYNEDFVLFEEESQTEEAAAKLKKEKKKSFGKGMVAGLIAALGIAMIVGTIIVIVVLKAIPGARTEKTSDNVATTSNNVNINMRQVDQKVRMIEKIINEYYLFDTDPQTVEDGIYSGMMESLGDPYSVYYREQDFADLLEDQSSQYSGIGALLTQDIETKEMIVLKVYKDSPAMEAGVENGDIIIGVDGLDVTAMDMDLVVKNYIRGPEGTDVTLKVLRGDDREEKSIKITRRQLEVHTVEYEMEDNNIGYISVAQFTEVTASQYEEAIEDLTAQGANAIIVDMRDNPGGLVDAAVKMLDYTLPDGLLVYTADRNGNGQKYYSEDGHQVDIPMVVLTNEYSASAAEIYTGAMIDFNRAYIIGDKTFGKGIVQSIIPLGDGTGIKVTQYHYYTPSGVDLHGEGLEPDLKVELDEKCRAFLDENDTQYKAAVEYIEENYLQ